MAERLSRQQRREIQREDERFLAVGLHARHNGRDLAAHVRHVVRLFRNPGSKCPSADVLAHVAEVFGLTTAPYARHDIACKKGCGYCCTQSVSVTPPEAFAIAAHIRGDAQKVDGVMRLAARVAAEPLEQRWGTGYRCPKLRDHS